MNHEKAEEMKDLLPEEKFKQIISNFNTIGPIMVLGDVGIDKYTMGEVHRISPEAPVPVINVHKEWLKLGMAANISHNLKTLGVPSTLFGVLGDDNNAKHFEDLLEEENLKTWGMVPLKDRMTTFKERVLTGVQQICRIDYESHRSLNDKECEELTRRLSDLHEGHSAIIIEDYAKGTVTESVARWVIDFFKKKGILVAVDPGRNVHATKYKGASLLKPNKKEAFTLAASLGHHSTDVKEVAKILSTELEIDDVIVTLGPEGSLLYQSKSNDPISIVPSIKTEVFDVSGAGDTVISLLVCSLVAGASLEEAAVIANCGGGVVVSKKGTATVDQSELTKYFKRYKKDLNGQS